MIEMIGDRYTKTITCDKSYGRDEGKQFLITEMSSYDGADWAYRAIILLTNAGINVPKNAEKMGMVALATVIFSKAVGSIDYNALKPLLNELMDCIKIIPDPKNPNVMRGLINSDISESLTIAKLQKEALMLHLNFLKPVDQ